MTPHLLSKANTPIKRVGLLLLSASIVGFVGLAVHWNVSSDLFFYRETISWVEKAPKPPAGTDDAVWRGGLYGWHQYDYKCLDGERAKAPNGIWLLSPPEKCQIRFVPHINRYRVEWRESVSDFFGNLFSRRYRGYFWSTYMLLGIAMLGLLFYSGAATRIGKWVVHGSKEG